MIGRDEKCELHTKMLVIRPDYKRKLGKFKGAVE
jgi:hypothetical protein